MAISYEKLLKIALQSNVIYIFFLIMFEFTGFSVLNILNTILLVVSYSILIVLAFVKRSNLKRLPFSIRLLFYAIIIWGIVVSIRGFSTSLQDIVTNLGNVYMTPAWLTPLYVIIGLEVKNWNIIRSTLNLVFKLMFVAFILYLFSFTKPIEQWLWLLRPLNFIFLVYLYKYTSIQKFYIFVMFVIYLTIATITKFRLEYLFTIFVLFLILLDRISWNQVKRITLKQILFIFPFILAYIFIFGYEHFSSILQRIVEFQDSRTFLFQELSGDMNPTEKLIGRGSTGTYYSNFFEKTARYYYMRGNTGWKGDEPVRITIEVGYLEMILKGGFIMLILNFLMMLISAYYGIFKSNNRFIKRLGFFILILLVLSIISFRPAYTPIFIILWTCIGSVLNRNNRDMTDSEIQEIIKFK